MVDVYKRQPVTTTDELIPSGETSSYRSNPLGLAEFTLSRKDPAYVGRAKEVQIAQKAIEEGKCPAEALPELKPVMEVIKKSYPQVSKENLGVGSTIFAVKPGDGSAREQAASCQKVLGGWANVANEYATKRYRSNLINWGCLLYTSWYITLPLIKNTMLVCITLCVAGNMKAFDNIYVMTKGGPGTASMVMAMYGYQVSFSQSNMGYGSCISVAIFVLSLLVIGGSQALIKYLTREKEA